MAKTIDFDQVREDVERSKRGKTALVETTTDRNNVESRSVYPWEDNSDAIVVRPIGRGTGQLLPDNLRRLPSEYIAEDIDDPNRVHELDPPHIREELAEEQYNAEGEEKPPESEPPPYRPVVQQLVDLISLKVKSIRLDAMLAEPSKENAKPFHLWWPENDIRVYEMRHGNPPPDSDRPVHLRGLDLIVDPTAPISDRILGAIEDDGKDGDFLRHLQQNLMAGFTKLTGVLN